MKTESLSWLSLCEASEITSVWRDTRLIVLTAQIAAIYAAILIPFKIGIPIIPGFVELRPANAIPLVASLLFGPAAAWGAGIGNIIGDCFGTLGPASIFGFLGNFFLGYIPYILWGRLGPISSKQAPHMKSWRQVFEFAVICTVASGACAMTISWGVEVLGLLPFWILAPAIFLNNMFMGILLGPPLLLFLYPRVRPWGLYYPDLKEELKAIRQSEVHQVTTSKVRGASDRSEEASPLVAFEDVTFRYKTADISALRRVSLQIQKGKWIAIMGERGSGKSTLCHCFNGLIPHFVPGLFSGTVKVNGESSTSVPVSIQAGRIGLVFQDFDTQLLSTNVQRELVFPLEYMVPSLSVAQMEERIQQTSKLLGLDTMFCRDPLSLSGGQKQRLVLASVLVTHPSLLVLDQPMTDLDPMTRKELGELFTSLREQGMTIVLSEQESEEVLKVDRVCVLKSGSVAWEGSPQELFGRPNLVRQLGLFAIPLAECFSEFSSLDRLPVTVEEAWEVSDSLGLTLEPPGNIVERGCALTSWHAETSPQEPILCLDEVSFGYSKEVCVLKKVSLSIAQGEFVAIIGRNGSGKSTLSKLMNGLLLPTTGKVVVGGHNTKVTSMSEVSRVVGYVFQNPDHQIFAETVWDEVGFSPKNLGFSDEDCERRIIEALESVGLDRESSKSQDPFSLSKGDRQRVAVASILAAKPEVLIFDEPTTGLDARETDRMMKMIRLLHQQGHTVIMITHAIRLVSEYATRCVLIDDGVILADDPTRIVLANPTLLKVVSLEVPPLTRFSQRWGHTLLTVEEVKASLQTL